MVDNFHERKSSYNLRYIVCSCNSREVVWDHGYREPIQNAGVSADPLSRTHSFDFCTFLVLARRRDGSFGYFCYGYYYFCCSSILRFHSSLSSAPAPFRTHRMTLSDFVPCTAITIVSSRPHPAAADLIPGGSPLAPWRPMLVSIVTVDLYPFARGDIPALLGSMGIANTMATFAFANFLSSRRCRQTPSHRLAGRRPVMGLDDPRSRKLRIRCASIRRQRPVRANGAHHLARRVRGSLRFSYFVCRQRELEVGGSLHVQNESSAF